MSGYQFGHIATYSRKGNSNHRSVFEICAEADRLPGHHPHVDEPLEPTLLGGTFRPAEVPAEIERRVAEAKISLKGKTKATRQVIRKDTHVLEAQVYSHPIYTRAAPPEHEGEDRPCMDNPEDKEAYLAWRELTVAFAHEEARRRHLEVLSIVEHVDEEHPHIHVLCVPLNPQLNAKLSHPGHIASARRQAQARERGVTAAKSNSPEEARAEPKAVKPGNRQGKRRGSDIGRKTPAAKSGGKKNKGEDLTEQQIIKRIGDRAYKAAMRRWQTLYYEEVGIDSGLTRHGPRRLRWSREQWRHSKVDAEAVAKLNQRRIENEQRAAAAEERREKAATEAAEFEASVQPGSKLYDSLRSIVDQAHNDRSVVVSEIEILNQDLEQARQTITDASDADARLQVAQSEEEAVRLRIAALAEEEREASARVANSQLESAAADDAVRRRDEAELKASEASERAVAAEKAAKEAEERKAQAARETADMLATVKSGQDALDERERELRAALSEAQKAKARADKLAQDAGRESAIAQGQIKGMAAWLSGDLKVHEDAITFSDKISAADRDSILAVGEWMKNAAIHLRTRLEDRVRELGRAMRDVVTATVEAWSSGLLVGITSRPAQAPALDLEGEGDAKKGFSERVRGWSTVVAAVFEQLPDFVALKEVERRAEALHSDLDAAEQRAVEDYTARLALFDRRNEIGPSGR